MTITVPTAPATGMYTVTAADGTAYSLMATSAAAARNTITRSRPTITVVSVAAEPERPYRITRRDGGSTIVLAANQAHAYTLYTADHPDSDAVASIAPTDATPLSEVARRIDPDTARQAVAYALSALGGHSGNVSDVLDQITEVLAPLVPPTLPTITDATDDDAADFWEATTY